MELYGSHFEYAGIKSRHYGLIFATVETSRFTSVSGEIETVSLFNKKDSRRYYIGDELSDSPVSFETEIVSERPLDKMTQRAVEKWLFFRKGYSPLFFDIDDDCNGETWDLINGRVKRYYLNCRFINPSKIEYNGGVVGYTVTVECDSPCAWQEAVLKEYALTNGAGRSTEIMLEVDTDMHEYIYPVVRIDIGSSGGDISIVNLSDDTTRITSFSGMQPTTAFRMDGHTNYISGSMYSKFKDKHFVRIMDGKNKLRVTGDIKKISFEWQNRRYL